MNTKRIILILMILFSSFYLFATTYTVNLDNSADFTSIQAAINIATHNDIILVYPGRYVGSLDTNGKNLTLQSLYAVESLQEHIENTIIDGNSRSCIRIENGESVTLNGFTFSNNYDDENIVCLDYSLTNNDGDGIRIHENSQADISNCIVTKNISRAGGGMLITGEQTYVSFNNVLITKNRAMIGGGISINRGAQVNMNDLKVYDNNAIYGADIKFSNYTLYEGTHIELTMGPIATDEIDNYFFVDTGNANPPYNPGIGNVTVNVQQAYFEQIDQDIYVAPGGSDYNSGLTPDEPLQTINKAMKLIAPNPISRNTVHVAPGVYSWSENNQRFPIGLKSHTRLIGAGIGESILEGEVSLLNFGGSLIENIEFGGFTFQNSSGYDLAPIYIKENKDTYLHDLCFDNTRHGWHSGIVVVKGDCIIDNVIVQNNAVYGDGATASFELNVGNFDVSNVIIRNQKIYQDIDNALGIEMWNSDVSIRNLTITDCYGEDAFLIQYIINHQDHIDKKFELHNALIFNNEVYTGYWTIAPIHVNHIYHVDSDDISTNKVLIANSTIANNMTNRRPLIVSGMSMICNNILYNPNNNQEEANITNQIIAPDMSYNSLVGCYFYNNICQSDDVWMSSPDLFFDDGTIYSGEPLFAGEFDETLDISDVDYYKLSENSPCIDAGYHDTSFLPQMDLAGNQRVSGSAVDMGVFEYGAEPYVANEDNEVHSVPQNKLLVYPNPAYLSGDNTKSTRAVNLEFTVPQKTKEQPTVTIYNIKGQKVKSWKLNNSYQDLQRHAGLRDSDAGAHLYSTFWDIKNEQNRTVASGVYFVQVKADNYRSIGKVLVMK
ncbi:MAG: choice-of-anchor Q domain-containing protein [Candidatus Cloacimonadales bacterium]